eukprot:346539-Amphidinium_carterae.1
MHVHGSKILASSIMWPFVELRPRIDPQSAYLVILHRVINALTVPLGSGLPQRPPRSCDATMT